jgi:AcrR family transcriptional regulator
VRASGFTLPAASSQAPGSLVVVCHLRISNTGGMSPRREQPMSDQIADSSRNKARQPKRKAGEIRFKLLLDALDELLVDNDIQDVGIYQIAERAGVPSASVYHFFPNKEAALVALAHRHHAALEALSAQLLPSPPASWQALVREKISLSASYHNQHKATLRLFYGVSMTVEMKSADISQTLRLAERRLALLEHYFLLTPVPGLLRRLGIAIAIVDGVFGLSYSQHGSITEEYVEEAQRGALAYLRCYLPEILFVQEASAST